MKTQKPVKKKRPPSAKMLRHLRRVHKMIRERTKARKAAELARREKARVSAAARRAAKKSTTASQPSAITP